MLHYITGNTHLSNCRLVHDPLYLHQRQRRTFPGGKAFLCQLRYNLPLA
jgi:hypothetical protein